MAQVEWRIKGPSFGNCNCDWGCPCQFNKLSTYGNCEGMDTMRIEEGHYGEVDLSGLCWINTFSWPGAVHEGNGSMQVIIDERASEEQRSALVEILHGRAAEPGSSFLEIFASTMTTMHDPLFLPIEFEVDVEKCEARSSVPGVLEAVGTPMIDPFDGKDHRVQLRIPNGMEFTVAECGSGTTKATAEVALDTKDTWGQFTIYHITQNGIVK